MPGMDAVDAIFLSRLLILKIIQGGARTAEAIEAKVRQMESDSQGQLSFFFPNGMGIGEYLEILSGEELLSKDSCETGPVWTCTRGGEATIAYGEGKVRPL